MMRRTLSTLLSALLLAVIISSVMAMTITIHSKLVENTKRASMELSKSISDVINQPALSLLLDDGDLILEVYAFTPIRLNNIIMLFENSTTINLPISLEVGNITRIKLIEDYRCDRLRVIVVLDSGQIIAWNPERDPNLRRIPRGWSGWFTCSIISSKGIEFESPDYIKEGVIASRRDPVTGYLVLEAMHPSANVREVITLSYSKNIELQTSSSLIRYRELPQGIWSEWRRGSIEIDRVRHGNYVLTLSAHVRVESREQNVATQIVWLMLSIGQQAVFRGRIEVVAPATNLTPPFQRLPTRTLEHQTVLVLAYSPAGDQVFDTTCRYDVSSSVFTVSGSASGAYETPGPIIVLYNGFEGLIKGITLRISITIEQVIVYDGRASTVRIEGIEAISVRSATLMFKPPVKSDYITISIFEVFRDSFANYTQPILKSCFTPTYCSSILVGRDWVHAWSPIGLFELEFRPKIGSVLRAWDRNYRCFSYDGTCYYWRIWGASNANFLPSPWTLPYLLDVKIHDARDRILLTTSANTGEAYLQNPPYHPHRGYAIIINDAPLTTSSRLLWVTGTIDWDALVVYVDASLWTNIYTHPFQRQSYFIASARTSAGGESVIVWVS